MRRLIALVFLSIGLALLAWSWWPVSQETRLLKISPSQMTLAGATVKADAPRLLTARQVILQFPARLRLGETGVIRLQFAVDPTGTADGMVGDAAPDLYTTHTVLADANLELSIPLVSQEALKPTGYVQIQPLLAEQSISFEWKIAPEYPATVQGVVWLKLQFIPIDAGPAIEQALSAQALNVSVDSLFGLSVVPVRAAGLVGILTAGLLLIFHSRLKSKHPLRRSPRKSP